jgi:hypothetical protein
MNKKQLAAKVKEMKARRKAEGKPEPTLAECYAAEAKYDAECNARRDRRKFLEALVRNNKQRAFIHKELAAMSIAENIVVNSELRSL